MVQFQITEKESYREVIGIIDISIKMSQDIKSACDDENWKLSFRVQVVQMYLSFIVRVSNV